MVQLLLDGPQAGLDVSQAFAKGELGKCQTQKLIATREAALPSVAAVSPHASVEFVPWDKLHQLRENQLTREHASPFSTKPWNKRLHYHRPN
jgi:hypothetical protein